ncbi:methyltransferase domain-containing protein [Mycobacterium xenopi]|uniref:methyltransferase domain-containing protein n=1 Tax=Mycobacterium xenopi TaxID=1789 RepID=UPI0022EB4C9D|nr:methyltransferase domain-containing protein [Mycobacterium xenopi]MDA3641052.1 methyltransferase domain-containing protein [Mycobacterium xenopi]
MTDLNTTTLPPALRKALELLIDPPADPDVSKGYLDLLGAASGQESAPSKGVIQAIWTSPVVATIYDTQQALVRRLLGVLRLPIEWLNISAGATVLDVGCRPASITASLAHAVGAEGLVLGVDLSEAMLSRAARTQWGPQVGFLRADAQQLPLRDQTVDAVVSIAVLQLVPNPAAALAEMARVLRPGGRLAVMVPTAGRAARLWRVLPDIGAYVFGEDEIADILEDHGFVSVRTKVVGTFQWVRAKRG